MRSCSSSFGKTIRDATEHFLAYLRATHRSVPVSRLMKEVQASKVKDGAGKRHLGDLKSRLAVFERDFGPATGSRDHRSAELDDWLRGLPVGPAGRNNFRKVVGGRFPQRSPAATALANPTAATACAR